ncbi:MAG TPA: EipA family protein, partial [Kaistiaceae bacterium]|nr:EipA family protein [Kaistiaceae bacterium]
PSIDAIFRRFVGVAGSAYLVGGFGMTVLSNHDIYVVPVRAGVGARLGVNVGYLKFRQKPTWNPF